jgi:16S rRNA (guanine1516-N2)-methyltransferase
LSEATSFLSSLDSKIYPNLGIELVEDGVVIDWFQSPNHLQFKHSYIEPRLMRRIQPRQALVKACSNKQHNINHILDLTGGWGMDSLILAYHGRNVTMLEQCELVYHIACYSLNRARSINHLMAAANRIELIHTSSVDYLLAREDSRIYDCIYLDPMFPDHKSSAKPAGEMQILQHLTQNQDIDECFRLALEKAGKRVVVKRPAKSTPFSELTPDLVYRQKTIRFDVYLTNNPD